MLREPPVFQSVPISLNSYLCSLHPSIRYFYTLMRFHLSLVFSSLKNLGCLTWNAPVPQSSWLLADLPAVALSLSCHGEPRAGCGAPAVGSHVPHILFWQLPSSCMAPAGTDCCMGVSPQSRPWHCSCWTASGSWQPVFQVLWMEAQPSGASATSASCCLQTQILIWKPLGLPVLVCTEPDKQRPQLWLGPLCAKLTELMMSS